MCYQIYLDVSLTQTLVMPFQISKRKKYAHKLGSVTLFNGHSELGLRIGGTMVKEERMVENKFVSRKYYFDTYGWN